MEAAEDATTLGMYEDEGAAEDTTTPTPTEHPRKLSVQT